MKANSVLIALIVFAINVLSMKNDQAADHIESENKIQKTAWFNADYRWGGFKRYVA